MGRLDRGMLGGNLSGLQGRLSRAEMDNDISLAAAVRALFANNEQGAWYDPSDFSTLYQDAAGTTPVTAVEQPVGRILDKSGRGNHATQATSAARPTLKQDAGGRYYLNFDGVDDFLVTGNIDFTATDKMTVWAGVHKASDAAIGVLVEQGGGTAPAVALFAPLTLATPDFAFRSGGTTNVTTTLAAAAPATAVLCGIGDIANDVTQLRLNGIAGAVNTGDQGTGNYRNSTLSIGSRSSSFYFNGRLYGLAIRGAASSASQIGSVERFMANKSGVTL